MAKYSGAKSSYKVYLAGIPLPIVPSKIETKINGNNKTFTLINGGEVNQIKTPGLTEISFTCLLPQLQAYPFAYYVDNKFQNAEYFLSHFEKLMKNGKPFKLIITRRSPMGNVLLYTGSLPKGTKTKENVSFYVTLEKYTIKEDAKNGFDIEVTIKLKQYREYGIEKLKKVSSTGKTTTKKSSTKKARTIPKTYTVKKGDNLNNIAKKVLGDSTRRNEIYKLNKTLIEKVAKQHGRLSSSNGYWIWAGTVLKMPK